MTPGQSVYLAELRAAPLHHDGTHRRPWRDLPRDVRDNWERHAESGPRWTGFMHLAHSGLYHSARPHSERITAAVATMLQALEA